MLMYFALMPNGETQEDYLANPAAPFLIKETFAMPWIQTRDILNLSRDFYRQMHRIYDELSDHNDLQRMEILLSPSVAMSNIWKGKSSL